jgi:hypothetical protein
MVGWLSSFAATSTLAKLSGATRLTIAEAVDRGHQPLTALSAAQAAIVTTLADLILPRTDTPSATDVGVPQFIDHLLANWYSPAEKAELLQGIGAIDQLARDRFGSGLVALKPADQTALLTELDGKTGAAGSAPSGFGKIKSLTVYGYFTSKRIQTEVLKTAIIPGRFDGCIPIPAR